MSTVTPLVDVRQLVKVYRPSPLWMRFLLRSAIDRPVEALRGVSFQVGAGDICAVVGPNGAGKSTLFRVLTGLTTPTEGSATVLGLDVTHQSQAVRRIVGFVPADDRSLYLRHTASENLIFHGRLQGMALPDARSKAQEMLELVGLGHAAGRAGFALSSGMRARLQLARALLHGPRVLILDEPTSAIDPVGAHQLLSLIERLTHEMKLAVLLSSHRLEEIEALRDHVLLLDRGELVYQGDIESLRHTWDAPRLRIRFAEPAAAVAASAKLRAVAGIETVDQIAGEVTVATTMRAGAVLGVLNGQLAKIESVEETRISLRELLIQVAGDERRPSQGSGES